MTLHRYETAVRQQAGDERRSVIANVMDNAWYLRSVTYTKEWKQNVYMCSSFIYILQG
jgi:hypothetical protein